MPAELYNLFLSTFFLAIKCGYLQFKVPLTSGHLHLMAGDITKNYSFYIIFDMFFNIVNSQCLVCEEK